MRVEINPELFRWARKRAGYDIATLAKRFPKLADWEQGTAQPTLKQLEAFAKATHTAVGFLFLDNPPVEQIPIPDFRTMNNQGAGHYPSPELLDTVYLCQQRQEWYREFVRANGEPPLPFVGSATLASPPDEIAGKMREVVGVRAAEQRELPTWSEALRRLVELADSKGILVMRSSVVFNNNTRRLDPNEFRGFALADKFAPLIFINSADTKAAQIFTLAHELAHIWLGQSAVSDTQAASVPNHRTEQWCNQTAAEFLVPLSLLKNEYQQDHDFNNELERLAKYFKVSTLVVLFRLQDADYLTKAEFRQTYQQELERLSQIPRSESSGGGDFYRTQVTRIGQRFSRALVISTLEGRTLYRDAFRLLGFSKLDTFNKLGRSLGVIT